jgi:hypothetical protein
VSVELSVVLATDTFETIRDTVAHLSAQTAREQVELVVVTPSARGFDLDAGTHDGFAAVRVVEASSDLLDVARLRAAGVRAAEAPVVLFAETHSFPEPTSLEALIEAHRGGWAAVGQAVGNGNPRTTLSWTNQYLDYGPWTEPCAGGPIDTIPTHNGSFKRDVLLAAGEKLPHLLRYSDAIVALIRGRGERCYLEPRAATFHVNVSRPSSWLVERLAAGRAYAGVRGEDWPAWRRAVYVAGSPLIPLVRARRVVRDIRRTGRSAELLPRILPALTVGLVLSALGELAGYALGPGTAQRRIGEMELHRRAHVRRGDWP